MSAKERERNKKETTNDSRYSTMYNLQFVHNRPSVDSALSHLPCFLFACGSQNEHTHFVFPLAFFFIFSTQNVYAYFLVCCFAFNFFDEFLSSLFPILAFSHSNNDSLGDILIHSKMFFVNLFIHPAIARNTCLITPPHTLLSIGPFTICHIETLWFCKQHDRRKKKRTDFNCLFLFTTSYFASTVNRCTST